MSPTKIFLDNSIIDRVKDLIANGQKILAIKLIRSHGRILNKKDVGLKEAKYAADNLQTSNPDSPAIIVASWKINSVIASGPLGEKIEMDLDTLQMHFLSSLRSVGVEEVNNLLDLLNYIREWQGEDSV